MKLTDFIQAPKSLMIAAAGHGKTHTIAECIQLCPDGKCQLILTHTHAGIASIKAKMVELKVDTKKYHVETIDSFVQQYVLAYTKEEDLPDQKDSKPYFVSVMDKAVILFSNKHILDVVKLTYAGLFVDEYQDCNERQHQVIMELATVLPTHVLGDELQGIFGFDGRAVSFANDLSEFTLFDLLKKPWRWYKEGNCQALGDKILEWRNVLQSNNKLIRLEDDAAANIKVLVWRLEAKDSNQDYFSWVRNVANDYDCESLLILFPMFRDEHDIPHGGIEERVKHRARFDYEHRFLMVEAIDDRAFYSNAKRVDEFMADITTARKKEKKLYDLLDGLTFKTTDLDKWIKVDESRFIDKIGENAPKAEKLSSLFNGFIEIPSKRGVLALLYFFMKDVGMKPKRYEIVYSILSCLKNYPGSDKTVLDSMKEVRNTVRRSGRKIQGRCIGTTLLTKGLEFDTVIVLDAHRFEDSKNFYVAISRACKRLVIITKNPMLRFTK